MEIACIHHDTVLDENVIVEINQISDTFTNKLIWIVFDDSAHYTVIGEISYTVNNDYTKLELRIIK